MADTFTALLRMRKLETNANVGTWGPLLDTGFWQMLEDSIAREAVIDLTAGNVTLSSANGTTDQARCAMLRFTNVAAARTVTAPVTSKIYVCNHVNGSGTVTFRAGVGDPGVSFLPGEIKLCFVDAAGPTMRLLNNQFVVAGSATTTLTLPIINGAAVASVPLRYFVQGNRVYVNLERHTTTISTGVWLYDLGAALFPVGLLPHTNFYGHGGVIDNAVQNPAILTVTTGGFMGLLRPSGVAWTAAVAKTIPYDWSVSWPYN